MMTYRMKYNLHILARHSDEHVWNSLLCYCRAKGKRNELDPSDAEDIYDVVRAEYDRAHKRETSPNPMARAIAVRRIKNAISNSGE